MIYLTPACRDMYIYIFDYSWLYPMFQFVIPKEQMVVEERCSLAPSCSQLPGRLDGLSEESAARLLSSRGASHTRLGGSLVWAAQATLVASLRTVNGTYPGIEPPSTLQNGII